VANVNHPDLVPTQISTKPNLVPPIRDGVPTMVGRDNSNGSGPPIGAPGPGTGGGGGTLVPTTVVVDPGTPPPAPTPAPPRVVHKTRVLNSEALLLPKPIYSTLAKQAHASGTVSVQILIDEKGKVISAKSTGGHPLLVVEAIKAAYLAKFSPTIVGDNPVKVSGTITYNFVLQ
jgi:TonB family protein